MKRTILASIVGLAAMAAATVSYGQGKIVLDNYDSTVAGGNQLITYGAGSGGTVGTGISGAQWTIGWYWVGGTATIGSDPSGIADPSTLSGGLTLDNNDPGDTAKLVGAGYYVNSTPGVFEGVASGPATIMIVAYNGANYDASTIRGHSAAFTMTPAQTPATPPLTGDAMPSFSVLPVPEPSILALSGIGAAALMLIRRKKVS